MIVDLGCWVCVTATQKYNKKFIEVFVIKLHINNINNNNDGESCWA